MMPEQRGGGSLTYYSSVFNSTGIRNKERMPPPHPNSNVDTFPSLNFVGRTQQSAQQIPGPSNRLHNPKPRQNKLGEVRDLLNSNFSKVSDRKNVAKPEAYISTFPHEDQKKLSNGDALKALQKLREESNDQHTPSPPKTNVDDVDVDEKTGVKCTFEKPCAWTFDTNVLGPNFEVATGLQLKEANSTGWLHNV